jgi:hypothetical protein
MISITINTSRTALARINMECINLYNDGDVGDYSVQIALHDGANGISLIQRKVEGFPRRRYNVLGLLQLALDTLSETELYLDPSASIDDARRTSDLARKLDRTLQALQVGGLHHH